MSLQLKLPQRSFVVLVLALLVADCALGFLAIRRATSLTDFLFFHIGVLGLMLCPLLASYYLLRPQATNAFCLRALLVFLQFLLALTLLLGAIDSNPLRELLEVIHRRFRHPSWQLLGLTLAIVVYLPLIIRRVRQKLREQQFADLAVGSALMLFLLFLYLPFGFNSIGHWESWGYRAYLEGQHSWNVELELIYALLGDGAAPAGEHHRPGFICRFPSGASFDLLGKADAAFRHFAGTWIYPTACVFDDHAFHGLPGQLRFDVTAVPA